MTKPEIIAWADQFGAHLRDECRQIQEVVYLTGWPHLAIEFTFDEEEWRLSYRQGHYWISNLSDETVDDVELDLDSLGVNRRGPV